jgi:serine/threonine protein kinase
MLPATIHGERVRFAHFGREIKGSEDVHIHFVSLQSKHHTIRAVCKSAKEVTDISPLRAVLFIDPTITMPILAVRHSRFYHTSTEPQSATNEWTTLTMQEGADDLYTYLEHNEFLLSLTICRSIIHQLVTKLGKAHAQGWAHLDISLENLLWDEDERDLRIIDWELGTKLDKEVTHHFRVGTWSDPLSGKIQYMTREHFQEQPWNGFQEDVFAVSVIMFMLLAGIIPFTDCEDNNYDLFQEGRWEEIVGRFNQAHLLLRLKTAAPLTALGKRLASVNRPCGLDQVSLPL